MLPAVHHTSRLAVRGTTGALSRLPQRMRPSLRTVLAPATSIPARRMSSAWDDQPSPPRLPPEQQAEFERLVRNAQESAHAASLADAVAAANAAADARAIQAQADDKAEALLKEAASSSVAASGDDASPTAGLNGNPIEGVWRGAPPEFHGDRNPKTGEVGGPKNEPLRWGGAGDWSYNGRVTDF